MSLTEQDRRPISTTPLTDASAPSRVESESTAPYCATDRLLQASVSMDSHEAGRAVYRKIEALQVGAYDRQDLFALRASMNICALLEQWESTGRDIFSNPHLARHLDRVVTHALAEVEVRKRTPSAGLTTIGFVLEQHEVPRHFAVKREPNGTYLIDCTFWGIPSNYGDHTGIAYPKTLEINHGVLHHRSHEQPVLCIPVVSVYSGTVLGVPCEITDSWRFHNNGEDFHYKFVFKSERDAVDFEYRLGRRCAEKRPEDVLRESLQDPKTIEKILENYGCFVNNILRLDRPDEWRVPGYIVKLQAEKTLGEWIAYTAEYERLPGLPEEDLCGRFFEEVRERSEDAFTAERTRHVAGFSFTIPRWFYFATASDPEYGAKKWSSI